MRRHPAWIGTLALGALALTAGSSYGVVERPYPLSLALDDSQFIFAAQVASLDPDKPAAVFTVEEDLKGKAPFRRLAVGLAGDAEARKANQAPQLLKRLAPKLPLVIFAVQIGQDFMAFVYTNGTWFQIAGQKTDDGVRWSFNHFEPYLRRTFKGPTAELKQVVKDVLAGKQKAPDLDRKEKPGLGPEVEANGGRQPPGMTPERKNMHQGADAPRSPGLTTGPVFAVIPTVLVGGPLAVLAMLFPTVFGGWKRWLALISVAGTVSGVWFVHWLVADSLAGSWWGSTPALWLALALTTLAGAAWAWRRHFARVRAGQAPAAPGKVETTVLLVLALLGAGLVTYALATRQALTGPEWLPVVAFGAGAWAAAGYVGYLRWAAHRQGPALATEAVLLSGMVVACFVLGGAVQARSVPAGDGGVEVGAALARPGQFTVHPGRLVWTFRAPDKGAIASSPLVAGGRVYVGAGHDSFFKPYGAVYCLDAETGELVWSFHDDKHMKQVSISSPCLAGGKLYIGEGYHQDSDCKVYCLDAETGRKLWDFRTGSHTESSPAVVDGRLYIGAGDDGLYCLDAATGEEFWHFTGLHVDASPAVAGGRVYCGSGPGDKYGDTQVFCLDAGTGQPLWRVSTDGLAAWASPVVAGGHVYFGVGNARFDGSTPNPGGAVLCLATEGGEIVWRRVVSEGVLARPALDGSAVYIGRRDGRCECLDHAGGVPSWTRDLGAPVVAAPALARCGCCGASTTLYALAGDREAVARLYCLAAADGRVCWSLDLAAQAQAAAELYSSPAVVVTPGPGGDVRRVYVGATLLTTARTAVLYCFEDRLEGGSGTP